MKVYAHRSAFPVQGLFHLSARKGTACGGFSAGFQPLALRSLIGLPRASLRHGLYGFSYQASAISVF